MRLNLDIFLPVIQSAETVRQRTGQKYLYTCRLSVQDHSVQRTELDRPLTDGLAVRRCQAHAHNPITNSSISTRCHDSYLIRKENEHHGSTTHETRDTMHVKRRSNGTLTVHTMGYTSQTQVQRTHSPISLWLQLDRGHL